MVNILENALAVLPNPGALAPGRRACFHCGEPCDGSEFEREAKSFCCNGCLTVHELLAESGLGRFYDLEPHPGIRLGRPAKDKHWAFLDQPDLASQLVDFSDERITRVTLQIPAIHCLACVWLLENLFQLNPAIGRCLVNFTKREAAISFATGRLALSELVALLTSIGYEPQLNLGELERPATNSARKREWLQIGIAGFAFGNIMLFSLPVYLGLDSLSGPAFKGLFGWLTLVLALPVVVYSAADYWRSALLSVRQRVLTLDVPIALGLAAIYAQSLYEVSTGAGGGYCDSLTGLILFLLGGRLFQKATYDRLAFDRDYKSFFPLSVLRKTPAGEETTALSNVRPGDRLVLRNGEMIPADSKLVHGRALLDYSFVTGESEPVEKAGGDYLYAGGKQIGGAIEVQTVKPVSQSYLTSLWNDDAFKKEREDHLNTLTNRYSRRFTQLVLAMAVTAALFWLSSADPSRAIKAFVSVLIVACPCALALAAPFALGTAQRLLAGGQVFLKNALVLERMARVDSIVFDKTGTLTARTNVVTFHPESEGKDLSPEEAQSVCSLARHSTHPHAARIREQLAARHALFTVRRFKETPGGGIEGRVSEHEFRLGSRPWLERHGIVISPGAQQAGSVSYLAIDGKCRGAFELTHVFRPELQQLLVNLRPGYKIALLSGDNDKERARFQDVFGLQARLLFNQTPLDKLRFVHRLQKLGQTVMMVGDGLNDAGALKQSDVGIAVVERAGAFSPASDVILEAGRVSQLFQILTFARKAARIVRFSFIISALYNVVGIAIAAAGLLSPLVCAILMPLSSVSVVLFACGATKWAARRGGLEIDEFRNSKRA